VIEENVLTTDQIAIRTIKSLAKYETTNSLILASFKEYSLQDITHHPIHLQHCIFVKHLDQPHFQVFSSSECCTYNDPFLR